MSQLKPVTLVFGGKTYKVDKQDSIWGLIEAIEDVVSFFELAAALSKQSYSAAKIFRAYAAALNYAGANVTPNYVRLSAGYKDLGEMAGNLLAITMMAQPAKDLNLGDDKGEVSEAQAEDAKKKATES